MKKLHSLLLLPLIALACAPEPGSARLEFIFDDDIPPLTETVHIFARVVDRPTGELLGGIGPVSLSPGQTSLDVPAISVPNGDDRIAIVEIREGPSTQTQILYYGRSTPFAIEPGEVTDVVIQVGLKSAPHAEPVGVAGT